MRKIRVKELDRDSFAVYGSYGQLITPETEKIGREPIEFFRDMVQLNLGSGSTASISVCRVCRRPFVIDTVEYHDGSSEGILPLDGDVIIHVAPRRLRRRSRCGQRADRASRTGLRPGL